MPRAARTRTSQAPHFDEDPRYRIAQRESLLCAGHCVAFLRPPYSARGVPCRTGANKVEGIVRGNVTPA